MVRWPFVPQVAKLKINVAQRKYILEFAILDQVNNVETSNGNNISKS